MGFGDFEKLCRTVPSYPQCNLFFRQVYGQLGSGQAAIDLNAAGVGVNPECSILRVGDGRLGNIADTILCGLSAIISLFLIIGVSKRQAAVGRVEFRGFVFLYLLSCVFQIFSLGSFLRQSTTAIVVLTAIHMGIVAALFWTLLMNAVVSLQWVEDGTMSSLVPYYGGAALFFIGTTYVSLDTGFTWTSGFETSVQDGLHNIPLFVLTNIWPGAVAVIFFVVMLYVIAVILRERRPLVFYIVAFILFAGAQVIRYVASKPLCDTADGKVDGSFLGTFLETASVIVLFLGWKSITEDTWEDTWNIR